MARTLARVVAPVALVLTLSGCALAARKHSVAELKYDPGRYQNQTVSVEGTVTSSWGVPLMPFRMYRVDDGTGEVTVLAQDGRVPSRGAHVRVKGRVNDVASFGGQAIGLHIQQTDLDFKKR